MISADLEHILSAGADVAHPGPGVQRPSISALVSSVDVDASQYVASSNIQEPRVEMIKDLKSMFKVRIPSEHSLHRRDVLSEFLN